IRVNRGDRTVFMHSYDDSDDETTASGPGLIAVAGIAVQRARLYYKLYLAAICVLLPLTFLAYLIIPPEYTASAVVGPPSLSPTTSLMNYMGMLSGTASLAKSFLSGSSGNGIDPFQEFQQLLQSQRLADELAEKDDVLPIVFYRKWDAEHHRWRPRGFVHQIASTVKHALHQPVTDYPDADMLAKFLNENLNVSQTPSIQGSIASLGSGYVTVTLQFEGRTQTEHLLKLILDRADKIIREDQLKDVNARITYLTSELRNVTGAEQRDSMIDILTNQDELRTMLVADQRYASTLADPAYTPNKP